MTKKQKVNEGEVPQYYVENSHPAIIDPLEFDMVQAEMSRRQKLGQSYSGASIFSSKAVCGDCGGFYGQKIWHSNDPYRKVTWRCNRKFKGKIVCETPSLDADTIKTGFLKAYNSLMGNREELLATGEVMREAVSDCTALNAEIDALNTEIKVVAEMVDQCVKENAVKKQSQEAYARKYNALVKRYDKAVARLNDATAERNSRAARDRELRIFISELTEKPLILEEWDEELWVSILETATVQRNGHITFLFKDGTSIEVGAE